MKYITPIPAYHGCSKKQLTILEFFLIVAKQFWSP